MLVSDEIDRCSDMRDAYAHPLLSYAAPMAGHCRGSADLSDKRQAAGNTDGSRSPPAGVRRFNTTRDDYVDPFLCA